jgi:adenylate cyclase
MRVWTQLRLSTSIILVLSTLVSLIFIGQAGYTIRQNDDRRHEEMRLRADLVTATQAAALSVPLWDYDKERASKGLSGMLQDPDVMSVHVFDDADEIFAHVAAEAVGLQQPGNGSGVITVKQDIYYKTDGGEERRVGHIEVQISEKRVYAAFKADLVGSSLSGLLILGVMICGLTIAIRAFTRPIMDMSELMRLRADGDFSADVDQRYIGRDDEIGDIARSMEADQQSRRDEVRLLETTSAIATQLDLDTLLEQIMDASSDLLNAERSTLFLYDVKEEQLWSRVAQSVNDIIITVKPGEGLAGNIFASGKPEIVDDPYNDPRFNREVDDQTGFRTRNMLCLPISDKKGTIIGLTQVLNKRDGGFNEHDIRRLTSLTAQASAAIENAKLFENVLTMRNYNESILRSLTNGVVSLDSDRHIQKINAAGKRILRLSEAELEGKNLGAVLGDENKWVIETLDHVRETGAPRQTMDHVLKLAETAEVAVNLSVAPLMDLEDNQTGYLFVIEDISEEKRMRGTMSRYVPARVVDQLLESGEDALGGVYQTATVLFSDIRSFTTISEKIGARATVAMLNEYFSDMVDLIDQHDGILDKYIGDAIMAVFGAPFTGEQDAENAVLTAWDMFDALDKLNLDRLARGDAAIKIGLGLNTGKVVVGNIGSTRRMDYTVIGDAVNLAARLEGATKQYGARFLISEFTWACLPVFLQAGFRVVDLIRVKGKLEPVSIYEGMGRNIDAIPYADDWRNALIAYRSQDWSTARQLFENIQKSRNDSDSVITLYLERIMAFENDAPSADWDGVWVMETK